MTEIIFHAASWVVKIVARSDTMSTGEHREASTATSALCPWFDAECRAIVVVLNIAFTDEREILLIEL